MMEYIKKFIFAIIFSLFISVSVYASDGKISVDPSLKIYDNSDLLTTEEEASLKILIDSYKEAHNIDLIIVTENDNSVEISEEYIDNFYNYNYFSDNALIILIDNTDFNEEIYYSILGEYTKSIYNDSSPSIKLLNNINNKYYLELESFIKTAEEEASSYSPPSNNKNNEVKTYSKIYDDADLLTESEKEMLNKLAEEFVSKYNMDLVIVTSVNKATTNSHRAYAEDFYDYNGFGVGKTYDGILVLIDRSYGYNYVEIVTTGEAIRIYDDIRIEYILDNMAAVASEGHYRMLEAFISSSSNYANQGVAPSNKNTYIDKNGDLVAKRVFPTYSFILVSLAVSSIIVVIFIFKNKMVKKASHATAYLDQNTINYTRREDRFINTHTTRTHIPRDNGGSSGGRVGGSSTSRGSSGRSHGGGGRRM